MVFPIVLYTLEYFACKEVATKFVCRLHAFPSVLDVSRGFGCLVGALVS